MDDAGNLKILDPTQSEDYAQWLQVWNAWPNREVFAHPDYVRLFAIGVGSARAAVLENAEGNVLFPFIIRDIPGGSHRDNATDIISPYGYGGMFTWGSGDEQPLAHTFQQQLDTWYAEQNVISEFMRLSLFSDDLLPYPATVTHRSDNVVVPLGVDEEQLWMSYEAKVRKNVKKALRNDVSVEIDETGSTLESFYRIFESTMDRREAKDSYYFSFDFFRDLSDSLRGNYILANAVHNNIIVSTELVLVSASAVYSFLGGTDSTSFDVRPNDLLKHEVNLWAKSQGKESYVLGGGYQKDDGIYRYKKSFAPHSIVPFYTAERAVDAAGYDRLVDAMMANLAADEQEDLRASSFFPLYRAR